MHRKLAHLQPKLGLFLPPLAGWTGIPSGHELEKAHWDHSGRGRAAGLFLLVLPMLSPGCAISTLQ